MPAATALKARGCFHNQENRPNLNEGEAEAMEMEFNIWCPMICLMGIDEVQLSDPFEK